MIVTTKKGAASVPDTHTVINGDRLAPICRKLAIDYDIAQEWGGNGRYYSPRTIGVIVHKKDADKLNSAIKLRNDKREQNALKAAEKEAKESQARLSAINAIWEKLTDAERSRQGQIRRYLIDKIKARGL